jgi:chromosome segregation protein
VRWKGLLLRRFEAYGFKSFADKVELEFGAGVTAIVGPNGSGKSNISDAIRWVLGEQNIRNLRGAKTEDIIFAGSSERRPLNVAEVSLIFDNSDNRIPLDYSEVIVTRRVYRSGESEYMINKTACRLKDIHDMLGDIGLGRESMAVISQSKVDEVLNSRPEDRRLLFEDAAGITKYKHRKRDALRKLDDTESNLTRVADIMAELGSQLEPLSESAARTEQYNQYESELTACQVSLLLHKLDRAQTMVNDIGKENEILTDQYIAESARLSACEAEAEGLTHNLSALEQQLQEQEADIAATAADLEKTDNRIAVLRERSAQKRLAAERVEQDVAQLMDRLNKASQDQTALEGELLEKRQQTSSAEIQVLSVDEQISAILTDIADKEQQITAASDGIFASLQEISAQRNLNVNLERDLVRYQSRRHHLLGEETEFTAKLTTVKEQSQQFDAEHARQENSLTALANEAASLVSLRASAEQKIADIQAEIRQTAGQITQRQSRLTVLLNMQRDLEGFNRGSKSVLTSQEPWRKGICGAVAQIIDVPTQYLTAIEVALGGAMQDIIAEDETTIRAAIQSLKQKNAGRVTFLPITNIKPRSVRDIEIRAANAPGAVGLAAGLVQCENRFRDIVEYLLGRVVIAESLEHALVIAKQSNFSLKIVTLEGELINPGGAITGGSMARRESSYLGRNSEIHNLEQVISSLRRQHEKLESSMTKMLEDESSINKKVDQLNLQRQEIGLRQAQLTAYREQASSEITRLTAALQVVSEEIAQCVSEEALLELKLKSTQENITILEQKDLNRKQAIGTDQAELRVLQQQRELLLTQATDRKIALSAIRQETLSLEQLLKSRQEDRLDIETRVNALSRERDEVLCAISQAEQEFDALILSRQSLNKQKQEFDENRFKLLGQKAGRLAELQKFERDGKELRRRTSTLESRLHELQLMLTRYELESTNSLTQLQEHHGINLAIARTLCRPDDPQTLMALVKQIEQDIALLGQVNPAAIDEYARAKDRYGFLEQQYQDLVTAKEQLSSIIGDIDSTMSKRFLAAFEAINSQFSEIFPRLFGGGKAQIELSDPSDTLGSGIEIFVQPPGKKQQNLALLSGGERALTVIALLFSLLAFRPAPFSVVDEIDAALDEANVQRFSEFLREFSRNTQFIVVTHRKGTMEVADVMHGVTMEDSGVSRIVSVRFMEKAG